MRTDESRRVGGGWRLFLSTLVVGLVGAIAAGILFVELWPMGAAAVVVGAIAGLIAEGRSGATGLALGILAALPLLVGIQFLTPMNTFINTEDAGELAGLWPLVLALWAGGIAAAFAGFVVTSAIRTRR